MCRVLMIAGIKPETNTKTIEFIKAMAGPMSVGQTDGLGYSAVKADGSLFGERWWYNAHAFQSIKAPEITPEVAELMASYGDAIKVEKETSVTLTENNYNKFGDVDLTQMTSITMHTRMATSAKGFQNTHPFHNAEADTSLIHNGVIRNVEKFDFKLSTCDSEAILISYLRNQVAHDTENVQKMADELDGYYACGVFGRDANGARTMDIFKANNAVLYGRFIKELGVFVYSTSDFNIEEACKKTGLTCGPKFTYHDEWLIRLNPNTGAVIKRQPFVQGKEWTSQASNWGANNTNSRNVNYTPAAGCAISPEATSKVTHITSRKKGDRLSRDMVLMMQMTQDIEVIDARELVEINRAMAQG